MQLSFNPPTLCFVGLATPSYTGRIVGVTAQGVSEPRPHNIINANHTPNGQPLDSHRDRALSRKSEIQMNASPIRVPLKERQRVDKHRPDETASFERCIPRNPSVVDRDFGYPNVVVAPSQLGCDDGCIVRGLRYVPIN